MTAAHTCVHLTGAAHSTPALTVILPVYNQERYVREAVKSILTQTFHDFELIVIDDGSTDATGRILQEFDDPRLRVIAGNHRGFLSALRIGIEHARAPWLARMDSDDISAPDRLQRQIGFLAEHPECVFVGSVFGIATPNNRFLVPSERFDWRLLEPDDITFAKVAFADPSAVFSRRIALEVGLYDEAFPKNEKALWYKMLTRGRGAVIGQPIYYVRWRLGSLSRSDLENARRTNNEIRLRYHPASAEKIAKRPLVREREANLHAAERCHNYYLLAQDYAAARQTAVQALRAAPLSARPWKMCLRSLLRRVSLRSPFRPGPHEFRPIGQPW